MSGDGKVVFITGAAGGLGRAAAAEFARRGCRLALVDVNADSLAEAVSELGGQHWSSAGDLADLAFAERTVAQAVSHFGRLDVLVNNAIWRELTTMRAISVESWEQTLRIGLTVPAFLARWAASAMERQGQGVILNVSSIMACRAGGVSPAYVAAKGGLDSLTFELAALYGPAGIRVLSVQPGAIDTQLSRDYQSQGGDPLADAMRAWSEDEIPLRRWARPEEIARALAMLASDDAAYLSGAVIAVDGGWLHNHFPGALRKKMFPAEP